MVDIADEHSIKTRIMRTSAIELSTPQASQAWAVAEAAPRVAKNSVTIIPAVVQCGQLFTRTN